MHFLIIANDGDRARIERVLRRPLWSIDMTRGWYECIKKNHMRDDTYMFLRITSRHSVHDTMDIYGRVLEEAAYYASFLRSELTTTITTRVIAMFDVADWTDDEILDCVKGQENTNLEKMFNGVWRKKVKKETLPASSSLPPVIEMQNKQADGDDDSFYFLKTYPNAETRLLLICDKAFRQSVIHRLIDDQQVLDRLNLDSTYIKAALSRVLSLDSYVALQTAYSDSTSARNKTLQAHDNNNQVGVNLDNSDDDGVVMTMETRMMSTTSSGSNAQIENDSQSEQRTEYDGYVI